MISKEIKIDKEFRYLLKKHSWWKTPFGHLIAKINGKHIMLHHLILPRKKGFVVDHINRNPADNRKSNLRYATCSQNIMNSKKHKDNTSGFRGVSWRNPRDGRKGCWIAQMGFQNKKIYIGRFNDIEEAAKAYKNKATELFQEYLGEI